MPPHLSDPSPRPVPLPLVVVVDDDPPLVAMLVELLEARGFAVEGFTDPREALTRLRGAPAPDFVLSDCLMPGLTGAELLDALAEAGVDAPVVLMTGLADPGFCVDVARVSVLNKPFQIEDLIAEIDASRRPASGVRSKSTRPTGS